MLNYWLIATCAKMLFQAIFLIFVIQSLQFVTSLVPLVRYRLFAALFRVSMHQLL